jgi:hypothetical protein
MSWEEFQAAKLGAAQTCSATLAGNHLMRDANALPETVSADPSLPPLIIHSSKISSKSISVAGPGRL